MGPKCVDLCLGIRRPDRIAFRKIEGNGLRLDDQEQRLALLAL